VTPLLTDKYQLTMAYAYWSTAHTRRGHATFDLFFRKAPFAGEFTVFAGLEEALRFVAAFRFTAARRRRRATSAAAERRRSRAFSTGSLALDSAGVRIDAVDEGSASSLPKCPCFRVAGPLAVCQLLETTLLVLINFAPRSSPPMRRVTASCWAKSARMSSSLDCVARRDPMAACRRRATRI
jgi:nicotinate phosphoribosyltransferase